MLICLISDVHGNLPALELVLKETKDADLYISLGDVVGYGPWSNECVEMLDAMDGIVLLAGNHEDNFMSRKYPGTNEIARAFHDHCIKLFSKYQSIENYVPEYRIENYYITHTLNDEIIFSDTDIELAQNTIIGHTHRQYSTMKQGYRLINPGSVGQNREYINVINYMMWDTVKDDFQSVSTGYDVEYVINKMEQMDYPEICVNYYRNKARR